MRTVGEILKEAREKKGFSFAEVSEATKIRVNFLQVLEENKFNKIVEATVVKGFIKNYAEYLGLSSRAVLAVFRRDFAENAKGQILPRGAYEPLDKKGFSWNPKMTVILVLGILVLMTIAYFFLNFLSMMGDPPLKIALPLDGLAVQESSVRLEGRTDPDASVFINNEIVNLSAEGRFKKEVFLSLGDNKIKVEAISRRGKKTVKQIKVKYEKQ